VPSGLSAISPINCLKIARPRCTFSGMDGSAVLNARGQIVAILNGGAGKNFTLGIPSHVVRDWTVAADLN